MSALKRKLTTLNIDQKIEILNALQSKAKTRKELSVEYGCDFSTVVRIVQQEQKIRSIQCLEFCSESMFSENKCFL
jgi:hypothetical protein